MLVIIMEFPAAALHNFHKVIPSLSAVFKQVCVQIIFIFGVQPFIVEDLCA